MKVKDETFKKKIMVKKKNCLKSTEELFTNSIKLIYENYLIIDENFNYEKSNFFFVYI